MEATRALIPLLLACVAARAAAADVAPEVTLEPPPGWSDVTADARVAGVLLSFRGPGGSAFVVARMPAEALDDAAATRAYLSRAVERLAASARLDFRADGRVETRLFRNGVSARLMRAQAGRRGLVVAALDTGGPPLFGTLASAAPDAMMDQLFGALQTGVAGAIRDGGEAVSLDGQLRLSLGDGLRSRRPSYDERRRGAVLAVQGEGSEVLFLKLEKGDAAPKDQAAIVRAIVADALRARLDAVSPAQRGATPAGPEAAYAWANTPGPDAERFAAGFLPWQYWGYSLLARGPRADDLLAGVLAALQQGPSAVPGLVAATPRVEFPSAQGRGAWLAAAAAALALLGAAAWSRRRKNARL